MLDSRATPDTRDHGSTVTFNIPNGLNAETETQTAVIQLLEFQASHSIYNIDSSNNKLEIFVQLYDSTGLALSKTNTSTVITITPGNYGASDLVSALNTAINAACVPVLKTSASSSQTTEYYYSSFGNNGFTTSGVTIQPVSLNQNTGKIIFNFPVSFTELSDAVGSTSSAYSNINFNAHIYSGFYLLSENYNGLLLTLGFKKSDFEYLPTANAHYGVGVLLTPTVTFASNISTVNYAINTNFPNLNDLTKSYVIDSAANITTPEIIDLSYPRYLYISIEGINSNNRANLPDSSFKNMFAKIPINSNFGELINYEPTQMAQQNVPNMHIQSLTVRILDEYGDAVDFNNGFWSLSVMVQWAMDIGSAGMEDITMGRTHRPVYFNGGHDPLQTYPEFVRNLKRRI
jgi:hypothetical protein